MHPLPWMLRLLLCTAVASAGWHAASARADDKHPAAAPGKKDAANPQADPSERLQRLLAAEIVVPQEYGEGRVVLSTLIEILEKRFGLTSIIVRFPTPNPGAFPDLQTLMESEIGSIKPGAKMPLGAFIETALMGIRSAEITYLVRDGRIEIIDAEDAVPERILIRGRFEDVPLDQAIRSLSRQSGLSIVLDPRLGEQRKTPIRAHFPRATPLAGAVRLMADMADAKVVIVDNVLYVTTRDNETAFPESKRPRMPEAGLGVAP